MTHSSCAAYPASDGLPMVSRFPLDSFLRCGIVTEVLRERAGQQGLYVLFPMAAAIGGDPVSQMCLYRGKIE